MPGPTSADAHPQTVGWVTSAPPLTTDGTSTATPATNSATTHARAGLSLPWSFLWQMSPFYFYVAAVSRVAVSRVHEPMLVAPFHCQHPSAGRTVQKVALDGSYSFRRNDDPLICTDEEKFCTDKIRLVVFSSTSCVSHLCVNNRQMKNVKTNLFNFSRTVFTSDTKQRRL